MALSPSPIDQLHRTQTRTPGWAGRLLMFSGTVLFVTVFAYFGLQFGYKPYLQKQIDQYQKEVDDFAKKIPVTTQNQIVLFYSQLANIKTLLAGHTLSSRLFEFFETKTLPTISYDKMNANTQTREVELTGRAASLQDFGVQLGVFQNEHRIQKAVVKNLAASLAGGWTFNILLTFDPTLFNQASVAVSSSTPTTQ
jgi:hypothetical protein